MLPLLTEATAEEKTNTCTDLLRPTYHWRPQTSQAIWIHASRRITVNTDNEERDRNISNGKGSLGHWHVCCGPEVLLTFPWKTLFDVSRTNYALRFTRWNKVVLSFFTVSEVRASCRLFHWGCQRQNRTVYAAWSWTLTHWNWQCRCCAVSIQFRVFEVTRVALLVTQGIFPT